MNGFIKEFVELLIVIRNATGREHREKRDFPVANLGGKHDLFLGYDWLVDHNPAIDWQKGTLHFDRCPSRCKMPAEQTSDDIPFLLDSADAPADYVGFTSDNDYEYVRAFESISTRIEHEAHPVVATDIPKQYREYKDVFEKKEFDRLLPHRRYDHEINLRPGWENDRRLRGKVYALSPKEREAMNAFLDENLAMGHIRPSNSPIASPRFFVGKKDGGLRPTMDYRRLNDHTVRDSYPLPLVADIMTVPAAPGLE